MSLHANKFAEREEKKRGGAWRECLYELWLVREWKLFDRKYHRTLLFFPRYPKRIPNGETVDYSIA